MNIKLYALQCKNDYEIDLQKITSSPVLARIKEKKSN